MIYILECVWLKLYVKSKGRICIRNLIQTASVRLRKNGRIIKKLEEIGCDTAMSVLALSAADIAKRADLEDETVEEILDILRAEFEDEE